MEAAFLIPVVMLLSLLICQPAILLYDRAVMEGAASEACRLLATRVADDTRFDDDSARDYVMRRLGMIPPLPIFHDHESGCYEISMEGEEGSDEVEVTIVNRVRLLPLIGQAAALLGGSGEGTYLLEVSVSLPAQADWVQGSPGDWAGSWD